MSKNIRKRGVNLCERHQMKRQEVVNYMNFY